MHKFIFIRQNYAKSSNLIILFICHRLILCHFFSLSNWCFIFIKLHKLIFYLNFFTTYVIYFYKCARVNLLPSVLKIGSADRTANRRGDRSGLNVGSVMQLDRWEPLKTEKTGKSVVFANRRFDWIRFFSAKSPKTTSFCIFF
jgi:hypothetical protein